MQFGRSADLDRADFSLPPIAARTQAMLASLGRPRPRLRPGPRSGSVDVDVTVDVDDPEPSLPWLRMGAPAFRHRDWLGTLYPANASPDDWLRIYATKVGALELNSTFYGLPSERTLQRWVAETPPHFRFCPKLPRTISHELSNPELPARVAAFVARLEQLGERLGPSFCQLPENVGPDALPQLRAAFATFPDDFELALELRNAGWFEHGALRDELVDWLEARGAIAVITDVAGRRDVSHTSLPAPRAFVRFVGEGGHASDEPRVVRWLERLRELRASGLRDAYFFVHQPDDICAPQLLALASERARAAGMEVPLVELERPAASQLDLF